MIEQLLGITELSEKAEVLKERQKETRDSIKEEEITINTIEQSNKRIEQNVKEIENRSKAWERNKEDKILELGNAIINLEKIDIEQELENHKLLNTIKDETLKFQTLTNDLDTAERSLNRSFDKLEELKSNLVDAESGTCPACGQGTAHLDTHEEYTEELKDKITAEQEYYDEIFAKVEDLQNRKQEFDLPEKPQINYSSLEDALQHKHNLETLKSQLEEKALEENPYVDQIDSLKNTGIQEISFDKMNELTYLQEHQEFLYKLLTSKDSFIRKKIIDQNIMYLNHRLAHYLDKLGLPHDVKFASDLGVEITEYGRDLDFDNLSRGERNRLILGLSWAFRDMYESLNRPMNLMCIDELIDSGMDSMGVENALGILKKMHREQGKNIMLISHKEELVGRVNNVLTVVKEGGFTNYNTDTEYVN